MYPDCQADRSYNSSASCHVIVAEKSTQTWTSKYGIVVSKFGHIIHSDCVLNVLYMGGKTSSRSLALLPWLQCQQAPGQLSSNISEKLRRLQRGSRKTRADTVDEGTIVTSTRHLLTRPQQAKLTGADACVAAAVVTPVIVHSLVHRCLCLKQTQTVSLSAALF
jgi:hypothetical protein